jgi:hypothetical protein
MARIRNLTPHRAGTLRRAVLALPLAAWLALPASAAGTADPAAGSPGPASAASPASPAGAGSTAVAIREGFLVNFAHRYYLPIEGVWELEPSAEADYQSLHLAALPAVTLQLLVSPGNVLPLGETIAALREHAAEDGRTHVIEESRLRVAGRDAGELLAVRTGKNPGDPLVIARTITFSKDDDKYYLRLEAPAGSIEQATEAFDRTVAKLKFEVRLRWPGSGGRP